MIELNYAEIYKEYKNGASIRKLANKYNCAATTLSNRLKEYCRENEIEFLTKKTKLELPMQDIYNMYCYEDKTSTELAKMFNCVPETIISNMLEDIRTTAIFTAAIVITAKTFPTKTLYLAVGRINTARIVLS